MSLLIPKLKCFKFRNSFRYYGRNLMARKAIRILNTPTGSIGQIEHEVAYPQKSEETSLNISKHNRVPVSVEETEGNVVPYEKLDKYDARFMKLLEVLKNRKKREKSGKILLEGKRLINDALGAGLKMQSLFFTQEEDLADIKFKDVEAIKVSKVLYKTMRLWSELTTCPGIMGVFKRPTADELSELSKPVIPVSILCNNIREPGNLGSVIRNAAAAGCENILLTKGCVDPWELKVLRAGCGGHFRIPIVNNIEWNQITNYIPSHSTIFICDNNADMDPVTLGTNFIIQDETVEPTEDLQYLKFNEHNQPVRIDESFDSRDEIEKYRDIQLPYHLYSCVKYPTDHIVLYIGGETHGVDPRIVKLACEYSGKKIKIPLENNMESLNSAFAMTIVLYEIKRQLSQFSITK